MPDSPAPTTLSETEHTTLAGLCDRAHARARETGAPVLACFAFTVAQPDVLRVSAAMGNGGGFRFYWERPKDDFALAAGGVASRLQASGAQRFREIDRDVHAALGAAEVGGEGPLAETGPYALGGFAFFDELPADVWPGFGAAQACVPEWLVLSEGGRSGAMVHAWVGAQEHPGPCVTRLATRAAEVRAAAGAHAVGSGTPLTHPENSAFTMADGVESHRRFVELVRDALERIHAGRMDKVVLAREVQLHCHAAPSPHAILEQLRRAYPGCFNFLVDPGAGEVFVGATPERLARFNGPTVRLGALAGSAPRGDRAEADDALGQRLMDSAKERWEHRIVVDAILDAVAPLGGEVERPEAPQLVKLSNVQHLYTPITLHADAPVSPYTLLERLHPTPAVGGHPRPVALEFIAHQEHFVRGWYAGPVGWLNARGEAEFAVALRSGTLSAERVRLFAGNGIVGDSDPEREYFETQLKLQPLLSALAHE